jgi:hypothetical protein
VVALAPYIEQDRVTENNPTLFEWFEKLELEMKKVDHKLVGRQLEFEVASETLSAWIDRYRERLRLHADARNGIFPTHRMRESADASG